MLPGKEHTITNQYHQFAAILSKSFESFSFKEQAYWAPVETVSALDIILYLNVIVFVLFRFVKEVGNPFIYFQ